MTGTDIVGTELPGGTYDVKRWMAYLWADATRNDDDRYRYAEETDVEGDGIDLPPEFATQIAVAGAGQSIEGILNEMNLDWDGGVFYAGQELTFHQALRSDTAFTITGEISEVERKHSDDGGFYLIGIDYHVRDGEDDPVFDSTMKIIAR
jgi:hypothetical protein